MMTRLLRFFGLAVCIVLLAAACGGSDAGSETEQEAPAGDASDQEPESDGGEVPGEADEGEEDSPSSQQLQEGESGSESDTSTGSEEASGDQPAESSAPELDEGEEPAAADDGPHPALLNPSLAAETAPAQCLVRFSTTKGDFLVELNRDWAPKGVDRLYNLVKIGYFQDIAFFRMVPGFIIQFGMHGNPEINAQWSAARIKDDPVKESNKTGYLTFAKSNLPNSRSTQFFINLKDNPNLDGMQFSPIGKVVAGMDVVESLNMEYGQAPSQGSIAREGTSYLKSNFPRLDYIESAEVVED